MIQEEKYQIRNAMIILLLVLLFVYGIVYYKYNSNNSSIKQLPSNTSSTILPQQTVSILNSETIPNIATNISNKDSSESNHNQIVDMVDIFERQKWNDSEIELNQDNENDSQREETINILDQLVSITPTTINTDSNSNTIGLAPGTWFTTSQLLDNLPNEEIAQDNNQTNQSQVILLPQTSVYLWWLPSLDSLTRDYQYILQDSKSIYYAKLYNSQQYDRTSRAQRQQGDTYMIDTEEELLQHELFGEKITFINLPQYEQTIVLMVAVTNGEMRFIQIPYSIYHESKTYLKNILY